MSQNRTTPPPRCINLAALLLAVALPAAAQPELESSAWRRTLERIADGVVSIRVDGVRAFDTDWNQSTQATGFIVDAERGLILTNRHVVTAGPVVAEAVFLNHEEVELRPIYRDPVHDFGFFQFDPAALRFIAPVELKLNASSAQVGREIRVVGNDAGEQLSILAGTLAKLDRRAPDYGRGKYNDFNTFYIQAASSTSGGSSGSPVIDVEGEVVALNAGANTGAASSFFLPLDRVERALLLIQADRPVTRGTLQTVFLHRPFDELRRLGLRDDIEAAVRSRDPDETGMLVVGEVVPGSPAADILQSGDILLSVDGQSIVKFVPLEAILDERVGHDVAVEFERGGVPQTHRLQVTDLHAISPSEYLEFGDAIVHKLSYQQARHFNLPVTGIYIANPGYVFGRAAIPRGAVITEFNGAPMRELDDFERALAELGDGQRATARFVTYEDPKNSSLRVVRMDRRWFPTSRCARDDREGDWDCVGLEDNTVPAAPAGGTTSFAANVDARAKALAPSLVMVNFDMPYTVSGVAERHYHGTGLVIDAARGFVVVDRNTVPVTLGDVTMTFAGSLEIPGNVEYIHPLHNLAVLRYDPALLGKTPVKTASIDPRPVEPGDKLWVVGLKADHRIATQATEVRSVDSLQLPLSRTFRFRDTNLEIINVVNAPGDVDGVLVNKRGRVVSMWSSFAFQGGRELGQINMGIPAELVLELRDLVREGRSVRSLGAEFSTVPLFAARKLGLDDDWARRLEKHNPKRRQILKVSRLVAGSAASGRVRPGDLLLAVDGKLVTTYREVEKSTQRESVTVTVWRDDAALELELATRALDGRGIDRIVRWAGAVLQAPHRELAAQRGIETNGVYVAYFGYGSPATRYGLWAGRRITEVDGQNVDDLDSFIAAVRDKRDRESVRLKTLTWNNAVEVITLKLDQRNWPTYELRLTEDGWQRLDIG